MAEVKLFTTLRFSQPTLLIGDELEDSDTVEDIPERFPLFMVLPLPEPLPLGFCVNKETIFGCD